jgi:hypothetical protein
MTMLERILRAVRAPLARLCHGYRTQDACGPPARMQALQKNREPPEIQILSGSRVLFNQDIGLLTCAS